MNFKLVDGVATAKKLAFWFKQPEKLKSAPLGDRVYVLALLDCNKFTE